MANADDILKLNLKELQILWANVTKSSDQVRAKSITMLIGEIAIVTFLFADKKGIPIPTIVYGVVFYWLGILLLVTSFMTFLWIISPSKWTHPVNMDTAEEIKKKYKNKSNYLEKLTDGYITVIQKNIIRLDSRTKPFVRAIYMISVGIFIMLLLKYGGGTIK